MQRCPSALILRLDGSVLLEQQPDHSFMPVQGGPMQRRPVRYCPSRPGAATSYSLHKILAESAEDQVRAWAKSINNIAYSYITTDGVTLNSTNKKPEIWSARFDRKGQLFEVFKSLVRFIQKAIINF